MLIDRDDLKRHADATEREDVTSVPVVPMTRMAVAEMATSHGMQTAMRVQLAPHVVSLVEQLVRMAKRGNRTAINGLVRIATASNASEDMLAAMAAAIGATSVLHMRHAASAAIDAEHTDEHTLWAQAEDHAQTYRREHGLPPLIEDPSWTAPTETDASLSATPGFQSGREDLPSPLSENHAEQTPGQEGATA